jgi:ubiquinone/menaquinone biosynthesis C-methylase UbiE
MKTLVDLFNIGMVRSYSEIIPSVEGLVLNLGAGKKLIEGSIPLDYPEWDANYMPIPYPDNSVDMIHAYHFLEHVECINFVMAEIKRVLKPGAHINIVVPYYTSHMQASDIFHCHVFTERTFEKMFRWEYYTKDKIEPMEIVTNFIMGDCEANLALMIQLRK